MARVTRLFLGAFVAALVLGGCSEITFEGGGPVTITITPDRTTVPVGGAVTFDVSAKGSILIGVVMTYGDGSSDSLEMAGAQTASGRFVHAFDTPGTYTVVGSLLDSVQGTVTAEVQVVVSGA